MRYALIKHTAGNVSIMRLIPQAVLHKDVVGPVAIDRWSTIGDAVVFVLGSSVGRLVVSRVDFDNGLTGRPDVEFVYPSVDDEIDKWPETQKETVDSWREIPLSSLPSDRTFREAWRDTSPEPVVDVDMVKARDIQRDRLRQMRSSLLAELDIEYQRADEVGDAAAKQAIAQRKQALRDVTDDPAIEAAKTPEELKLVIPEILGGS